MRGLLLLGVVAFYATNFNTGIANAEFVYDFFKTVSENEPGNMICSPISAKLIVLGAGVGAKGTTRNQIQSVLSSTEQDSNQRMGTFIKNLATYKEIELRVATNVFVANGYSLRLPFKSQIKTIFNSSVENINLRNPVKASWRINNWSAAHTNNRIKDVVTPADIKSDSVVVFINAIYFRAFWATPIYPNNTKLSPFYVNGKTMQQVPTMNTTGPYYCGNLPGLDASFVELPYRTHDAAHAVSMYIILPDKVDGIVELRKNLDKIHVDMFHDNDDLLEVEILLPKFKIESSLKLKAPLTKLGLGEMFSDKANFNGIAENGNLKISDVIQKAFLEVNEEGSEAAVITEGSGANRMDSKTFNVDHPFVTMVVTESKVILFSAIITDPRN